MPTPAAPTPAAPAKPAQLASRAGQAWRNRDRAGWRSIGSILAVLVGLLAWCAYGPSIAVRGALTLDTPGLYGAFLAGFAALAFGFWSSLVRAKWALAILLALLAGIYLAAAPGVLAAVWPLVVDTPQHRDWGIWAVGMLLGALALVTRFLLTLAGPRTVDVQLAVSPAAGTARVAAAPPAAPVDRVDRVDGEQP